MKRTNKLLLVAFLVLLAIFLVTKFFRSPALESNLDTERFRLDTATLSSLVIRFPGGKEDRLILERNDSSWAVHRGDKRAAARSFELDKLLGTLSSLEPERVVSRREEKWEQYEVNDSSALQLLAYRAGDSKIAEWFIGRQSGGVTYVRDADDPEIYAVEGDLRTMLSKDFNDWRDRTFLKVPTDLVNKITFKYPLDTGFVLEKAGRAWMIGNMEADSARVATYLNEIERKELNAFLEGPPPSSEPVVTIAIEGSKPHAIVKGWTKEADDGWTVSSTLQEDAYFDGSSFAQEIFRGRTWFLNGG